MVATELIPQSVKRFRERIHESRRYGRNDCCISVADVLKEELGKDLMHPFGRGYRTMAEFMGLINRRGCKTLRDAVAMAAVENGMQEITAKQPRDFDLGMVFATGGGRIVEVPAFYYSGAWHGQTPDGAVISLEAICAWRLQ